MWRITQKKSPEVFCKKDFLKISQDSQENAYVRVCLFFIKVAGLGLQLY